MDLKRRQPMGVELVKRGIVSEADIEKALEYQKKNPNRKLGDSIYILNLCNPDRLIQAIGEIIGEKGILLRKSNIKIKIPTIK